jgi:hypothetical protein
MSLLPLDGPAVYSNLNVSTTAIEVKVGASPLSERKVVTIQPLNGDIFFGYNSSVTTSTGTKIFQGQLFPFEAGESMPIFVIAASGTIDCRITEVA